MERWCVYCVLRGHISVFKGALEVNVPVPCPFQTSPLPARITGSKRLFGCENAARCTKHTTAQYMRQRACSHQSLAHRLVS